MRRALWSLALALLAWHGTVARAAEPSAPPSSPIAAPPTLRETVDAALGAIDVMVADRDGTPIGGLGVDDFTLRVGGQPVAITQVVQPAVSAAPLTLAVFLDEASLDPSARGRALTDVFAALDHELQPGDRMLLAAGRGGDLVLLQAPTADRAAMHAALAAALAHPPVSARASELRQLRSALAAASKAVEGGDVEERMQALLSAVDRTTILQEIRQYAARREGDNLAAMAALSRLVDGLAGLDGARAVLVVSGGLSTRPAAELFAAWTARFQGAALRDAQQRAQFEQGDARAVTAMAELGERAGRAGVRLYGLGLDEGGIESVHSGAAVPSQRGSERSDVGDALASLAEATGGTALAGAGAASGLTRSACRDRAGVYSLVWSPLANAAPPPTAKAKVEVTVRDEREVVRYARAVTTADPLERLRDRTVGALLFGGAENPLEIALQIDAEEAPAGGQPTATASAGGERRTLRLLVTVPLARLALVPEGRVHTGALVVLFGALDAEGRLAAVDATAVPIRIANDQLLAAFGGQASYRALLTVRAIAQRLAVSVRDQVGGIGATVVTAWSPEALPAATSPGDR